MFVSERDVIILLLWLWGFALLWGLLFICLVVIELQRQKAFAGLVNRLPAREFEFNNIAFDLKPIQIKFKRAKVIGRLLLAS
jgi:hypothetical protein